MFECFISKTSTHVPFISKTSTHVPFVEHIIFFFDLVESSHNITSLITFCQKVINFLEMVIELPGVTLPCINRISIFSGRSCLHNHFMSKFVFYNNILKTILFYRKYYAIDNIML